MSSVEELQAKLEKSEAARQKLRSSLSLLKERALNTGELVKQHQALQGRLGEAEQRAQRERSRREQAEATLTTLRREQEVMCSELQSVRQQASQAARAAQEAQAQAGAANRAQQLQQGDLDRLRGEVSGLSEEVQLLRQQLQAGPPATLVAPVTKRGRGAAVAGDADSGALAALKAQLGGLQEQYHAMHAELLRWKAALGGLALLANGSPPPEVLLGPPGGAEGSTMLAPLRVQHPAGVNESNVLNGTEDQGMGEHQPASGAFLGAALPPRLPAPGGSPAHAVRALWAEGGSRGARCDTQQVAAAAGAAGGGADARERALAAVKAAGPAGAGAEAAAAVGVAPAPPQRLRSPTRRQRPAAAALAQQQAVQQQAKQALVGGARPPAKRVRYMEPPAQLAERPRPVVGLAAGPPARSAAASAPVAAPAAGAAAAAEQEQAGEEGGEEEKERALAGAGLEPSLAVSANALPTDQAGPDRVAVQLGFITDDVAASMPLVHSVAAELAQALAHDRGCPLPVVLSGFQSALLHCAGAALPPGSQLSPPGSPPATHAAAVGAGPWMPPHCWFQEQPQQEQDAEGQQARPGALAAAVEGCYAAVWANPEALLGHKMRWLLRCALQLDLELSSQVQPVEHPANGPSPPGTPPAAAATAAPPLLFCEQLQQRLHRLVVAGCLGGGGGGAGISSHSTAGRAEAGPGGGGRRVGDAEAGQGSTPGPQLLAPAAHLIETELCALAAATAGLCRLAGNLQAFRAFVWDLLSIESPTPGMQLPPLTAALEVWPEALPALPHWLPGGTGEDPPSHAAAAAGGGSAEVQAAAVQLAAVHSKLQRLCARAAAEPSAAALPAGRPADAGGGALDGYEGGEGPSPTPHHILSVQRPAAAAVWLSQLGTQWWGWAAAFSSTARAEGEAASAELEVVGGGGEGVAAPAQEELLPETGAEVDGLEIEEI